MAAHPVRSVLSFTQVALSRKLSDKLMTLPERHTDSELDCCWSKGPVYWSFSDMRQEEADIFMFRNDADFILAVKAEVRARERFWLSSNVAQCALSIDEENDVDSWEGRIVSIIFEREQFRRLLCGWDIRQMFSSRVTGLRPHFLLDTFNKFKSLAWKGGYTEDEEVVEVTSFHERIFGGSGDEAGEEGQECEEEEQSVDPAEADTGPETTEIGQVGFIKSWQRVEVLFSPDTNQRFSILI